MTISLEPDRFAMDDLFAPEELHVDLRSSVKKHPLFGLMLQHPLVQMVPFAEQMNKMANINYAQKLECLARYEADHNWSGYIWAHERPWRPMILYDIRHRLSDYQYWRLVGNVWVDTESESDPYWPLLWGSKRSSRIKAVMNPEELARWRTLPPLLTLYRGEGTPSKPTQRWAWTLERTVAEFFARRFSPDKPRLLTAEVPRDRALALFLRRNESEVVLRPPLPKQWIVKRERVTPRAPTPTEELSGAYHATVNPSVTLDRS